MPGRHAAQGPPTVIKMRRDGQPIRHVNRHGSYRGSTMVLDPPDEEEAPLEPVRYAGRHRRR